MSHDSHAHSTDDQQDLDYTVKNSEVIFDGPIFAVRQDTIETSTGEAKRDVVEHFGSVAIAALKDDHLLMVRQYRHAVGRYLWEIPAGLLDMAREDPLTAAQRELAEEGAVAARKWSLLGDVISSPGFSEEMCRIFKAQYIHEDLSDFDIPEAADEEADMQHQWIPLSQALAWVQDGTVDNAIAVAAILHIAAGTERSIEEEFAFSSALGSRRAPKVAPGEDMKPVR